MWCASSRPILVNPQELGAANPLGGWGNYPKILVNPKEQRSRMSNPLTAFLTNPGGAFSGVAGPTQSAAQLAASAAASQPSPIPGMSLAAYTLLYGPPPSLPPTPFLNELPALTPAMAS